MKQILFAILFLQGIAVFAQANFGLDEKEKMIRQKIKLKNYPGGFEEEPLRVQSQLNAVTRKMAPVQEVSDEPAAAGDNAHD